MQNILLSLLPFTFFPASYQSVCRYKKINESQSYFSYHISLPHHLHFSLNTIMLFQNYWLWSLLFAISTNALVSSSSSSHTTSTTKKSLVPSSSSRHTTSITKKSVSSHHIRHHTRTTKKTISSTESSSHHSTIATSKKSTTSSKPTRTSTASSTPTLSTFYLVAEDTGLTDYNGVYLHEDPNLDTPGYPFTYLNPTNKNTLGAATFNLLPNNTLQYNGASGPQFASVADGHPQEQSVKFGYAGQIEMFGLDQLTCKIAAGAVTCASAQTGANTFFFYGSGAGNASLFIYEEVEYNPVTLKVVPV